MYWPRLHFTVWRALAVIAVAAVLVAGLFRLLPESPKVTACRQKAKTHQQKAGMWEGYAKLSEQGVTTLGPVTRFDGTSGEILSFNHFVPRPRPSGQLER